jgi:glyoxylase-like metal-dependent hydrolase (beta-lactamase superfamily II)
MANTFKVGSLSITVVSDGEVSFPAHQYFPGATPEQWEPHKRWLDHEGKITFPYACFLVRTGDELVLIDTGVGPVVTGIFTGGKLLGEMAAASVRPEEVTKVFVTHLHLDHCGTAAVEEAGAMRVTFPNASYHWTSADQAYFAAQPASPFIRKDIFDACAPRWSAADDGATIAPGVTVMALPGHTPGHAGVVLSSGSERALILGDAISCPAQLEEPEWSGLGDVDKELARKTQEAVAREAEGTGALVGAGHFPGLQFGRVLRGKGKRYWQPV